MKLEGSLDTFGLSDVFALLAMTGKTGALHLRRPEARGVLYFTGGALTGGASRVDRLQLARRLVAAGTVGDGPLAEAVQRARAERTGLVRVLLDGGAVAEAALHAAVAEHLVDSVFDLLRWPDGRFGFRPEEANPDDVGVSRPADEVVAAARSRLEAWARRDTAVPDNGQVLSLAVSPPDEPRIGREEWTLLALVDGRRTVGEITEMTGRGEYTVVSALADLLQRGLLAVGGGNGAAALLGRQELLAGLEAERSSADDGWADRPPPADQPAGHRTVADPAGAAGARAAATASPEPAGPPTSTRSPSATDPGAPGPTGAADPPGAGAKPDTGRPRTDRPPDGHRSAPDTDPTRTGRGSDGARTAAEPDGERTGPGPDGARTEPDPPAPGAPGEPEVDKGMLLRLIAGVQGL